MTGAIELEVRLSIAAIEACHKAGIPHIVYSALDDLPDEVRVPTYVSKAKGKLNQDTRLLKFFSC